MNQWLLMNKHTSEVRKSHQITSQPHHDHNHRIVRCTELGRTSQYFLSHGSSSEKISQCWCHLHAGFTKHTYGLRLISQFFHIARTLSPSAPLIPSARSHFLALPARTNQLHRLLDIDYSTDRVGTYPKHCAQFLTRAMRERHASVFWMDSNCSQSCCERTVD